MAIRFMAGIVVGALLAGGFLYVRRVVVWGAAEREMAPRMHAFVRALREPPANADPAPNWKPLAREPVGCADCHGDEGARMEEDIASGELAVDGGEPREHGKMVRLMERWVRELNREAGAKLRKAVTCLDCHARDPRRR